MRKRPITLRTPEVWVVEDDKERFLVSVAGKAGFPAKSFWDACETVKMVNEFFNHLQDVQDLVDAA